MRIVLLISMKVYKVDDNLNKYVHSILINLYIRHWFHIKAPSFPLNQKLMYLFYVACIILFWEFMKLNDTLRYDYLALPWILPISTHWCVLSYRVIICHKDALICICLNDVYGNEAGWCVGWGNVTEPFASWYTYENITAMKSWPILQTTL